jgi:hypothetical protein
MTFDMMCVMLRIHVCVCCDETNDDAVAEKDLFKISKPFKNFFHFQKSTMTHELEMFHFFEWSLFATRRVMMLDGECDTNDESFSVSENGRKPEQRQPTTQLATLSLFT